MSKKRTPEDDFAHFQRTLALQRGHRATATVTRPMDKVTQAQIDLALGNSIDPIGPTAYYLEKGKLRIGPLTTAPDLAYRPDAPNKPTLGEPKIGGSHFIPKRPEQVGGSHYAKLAIDPFTYAMANKLDSLQFSVVKYVTRFRDKNGLEDLKKCRDCLDRLIAHEEKKQ